MRLIAAIVVAGIVAVIAEHAGGQAPLAEIRGIVKDRKFVTLPDVDIQIRKLDRVPVIRLRSAADGSFRVPNLAAGIYRLIASATGFTTATVEGVLLTAESARTVAITLDPADTCRLGEVRGMGHIAGTVTDWTGDRVPAYITLERQGASVPERASWSRLDGRYDVELPPGKYTLRASIPGAAAAASEITVAAEQRLTVDARLGLPTLSARSLAPIAPSTSPTPSLFSGFGGIRGRVTDIYRGAMPGVTVAVEIDPGHTVQETTTDREGQFVLANVPPGRYQLRASMFGLETHVTTVNVSSGLWSTESPTVAIADPPDVFSPYLWDFPRGEAVVGIRTRFGDIKLVTTRNDFLACVDRGTYTSGTLELVTPPASTFYVLRLIHASGKPAAADAKIYGLTLIARPELVVTDPISGQPGVVEGRVFEGFTVIDRMVQSFPESTGQRWTAEIISISRLTRF